MGVVGSLSVDVQGRGGGVLSDSDLFGQTEKRMRGGGGEGVLKLDIFYGCHKCMVSSCDNYDRTHLNNQTDWKEKSDQCPNTKVFFSPHLDTFHVVDATPDLTIQVMSLTTTWNINSLNVSVAFI